ncbi:ABC transporter permease [Candidatus Saganbacteria bacterium]|nr:ABC transporter permease [Candidatus Saganbacteria bacterium]
MNLAEPFKLAVFSLLSNKLRSILTTLGVIIGVATVITLVSMGEGAKSYILSQISGWGVGANTLMIHPGDGDMGVPTLSITYQDSIALREKLKNLDYLMPEFVGRGKIKYGKKEYTPSFTMGVSADYPFAYKQKATEGRFFSKADENGRKPYVVIGKTIARKLFGGSTPINERIKINGIGFIVVGVLEEKGAMMTFDMDDMALIPTTLSESTLGISKIWEIFLVFNSEKDILPAIKDVNKILFARHKRIDFHAHTQAGVIDIYNNVLNALTGIISAIAGISLLVGGIGIMNIMLVSVTERTREIGIRKAIGAKQNDIFLQFLIESIIITMTGALIGVSLGTLASWGIMSALRLQAVIAYGAGLIACFGALLVGIFFGVYPAMMAARLDPVEALRHEA